MGECYSSPADTGFNENDNSDELMTSGVLLSRNLNHIVTQERESLRFTGYPIDRSKSWLVLSAGKGLNS